MWNQYQAFFSRGLQTQHIYNNSEVMYRVMGIIYMGTEFRVQVATSVLYVVSPSLLGYFSGGYSMRAYCSLSFRGRKVDVSAIRSTLYLGS